MSRSDQTLRTERALRVFSRVWAWLVFAFAAVAIVLGMVGGWIESGPMGAVRVLWDTLSPYNILWYLLIVALLSPAIAAHLAAERMADRQGIE